MSPIPNQVILGVILQQAGLVSGVRFKQALEQQNQSDIKSQIGEILANRGDISQQTANFFSEQWFKLVKEKPKQPIGQYLKQAGLLTDRQIQTILDEQKRTESKFGELAIAKGWLKQATVDFFLHYLVGKSNIQPKTKANQATNPADSPLNSQQTASITLESSEQLEYSQKVHEGFLQIKRKLLKLEDRDFYSKATLDRVLWWTSGQSFLTQKLFELLSQNTVDLAPEREIEQIDYLVQTKLLNDWENNELEQHLQTIRDRLLRQSARLLKYQEILSKTVPIDRSEEQQELLNMGLVVKQQEKLIVANRIYQLIFNRSWVSKQLAECCCEGDSAIATSGSNKKINRISNSSKLNPRLPRRSSLSQRGEKRSVAGFGKNLASQRLDFGRTIQTAGNNHFVQLKNVLLLLTFVGLLSLLFNNVAKRMAVRVAFQKGNQLLKQKLYDRAIVEYDRLLDLDSNYHEVWTYRGYALAGLQRYQEMEESCSTATIVESNAVYAWNCRGEALYNLGKNQEAIAAFDRAIALDKSEPIFLINKSRSLKALGKDEAVIVVIGEAIKILEQIEAVQGDRSISKEFAVALTFLGNSYVQKKQEQAAIDSYTRALTYVPDYFPAQIGKGIALNLTKRFDQARDEFNRILDNAMITPTQQAQTLFYLGQTLCSSQQNLSGIATLEKAIELKPDYKIAEQALEKCI